MRNGGNITSLWNRIRNPFSCRKHPRRAIDKVWAVKVCVCVCDANDNEVCTSQVHVSPFPSYPLPRSCQGIDASKISFQFPELFLLQFRIQGYQTGWAMLLNLFWWHQHKKNTTISAASDSRVGLLIFRLGLFSDVQFLSPLLDRWSDVTRM
jgi:hypothetical protein